MGDFSPTVITERGLILGERLGQGSYAVVYKAYNRICRSDGTRQLLAVKCVAKSKICVTQTAKDNLIREIEILKKLDHPNIVRLIDFLWDKDYIYLIMEYCNAGDLSQFIRKRRQCENSATKKNLFTLPETVTRKFLLMLASAMKYLRSKRISHMDLKPQNILLSNSPDEGIVLKLADFGFSTKLYYGDRVTSMRGSPLYMAPEIFKNQSYDARVDLWSIGVILYECLFGKAPFASDSMTELVERITSQEPIVFAENPVFSPCCRDLVSKLLIRDPDRRMGFYEFFAHKFVDEKYSPCEECLEVALKLLDKAEKIESDRPLERSGDQLVAFKLYCEALDYLVCSLQYAARRKDDPAARNLRLTMRSTLAKAERLKERLKPVVAMGANSPPPHCDRRESEESGGGGGGDAPLEATLRAAWSDTPQIDAALTLKTYAETLLLANGRREAALETALDKYQLAIESLLRVVNQWKVDKEAGGGQSERFNVLRRVVERWLRRAERIQSFLRLSQVHLSATSLEAKQREAQVSADEKTRKLVQENLCRLQ